MPHTDPKNIGRAFEPCPSLPESPGDLIIACPKCDALALLCCQSDHRDIISEEAHACHHRRLVMTDGACVNNGRLGAVSGVGVAIGYLGREGEVERNSGRVDQWSIAVDDKMDPGAKRSSQRAELLAATEGLKRLAETDEWYGDESARNLATIPVYRRKLSDKSPWIIATDSEYVVKGMTEWLPKWKENNFRTSSGTRPSNLDLFLRLDAEIEKQESRKYVHVQFWHIKREFTALADWLAKDATRGTIEAQDRAQIAY